MFSWTVSFVIFVIVSIVIGVFITQKHSDELGSSTALIMIALFLLLSMWGGLDAISNYSEENIVYEYKNKVDIYSLEDNITTNGRYAGSFIMGYGAVNSDIYYYTLVGNNTDGFVVKKFNSSDTYLITDEEISPYYIEKYKIYDRKCGDNWLFGGLIKQYKTKRVEELDKKELHISKDHIKRSYNIDLK